MGIMKALSLTLHSSEKIAKMTSSNNAMELLYTFPNFVIYWEYISDSKT